MSNEDLSNLLEKKFVKFKKDNNDFYDLSDLTIIIPTYNRSAYLIRQIIYLSNSSASLIIADGSENKIDQKIIDRLKLFRDFEYIHSTDLSYVDRIKFSSKKIQSKYAMCLAEDDFLVFSSVQKALQVLGSDKLLSACFGQIAALDYNKSKNKSYLIKYGSSLKNYSIRQNDPKERLLFAFNSYRSFSPYAVFRQNHFKEIWSRIDTSFCLELTEYEHAINTLLIGQITTIDELFWVRSQELESLDNKLDGSRKNNFKKWYTDKAFENDVKKFKERTLNNLIYYLDCSYEDALTILNKVIKKILNSNNHMGLVDKNYFKHMLSLLVNFMKSFSFIINIYNKFKNVNFSIKLRLLIRSFGSKTVKSNFYRKNAAEIDKILQITDFFHK
jgi:glycosyltransferase domain-containing protein